MQKAIGKPRMTLLKAAKAPCFMTVCTHICIEKKAMIGMQIIGIGALKRRCRQIHWMRNGSGWWSYLWGNLKVISTMEILDKHLFDVKRA